MSTTQKILLILFNALIIILIIITSVITSELDNIHQDVRDTCMITYTHDTGSTAYSAACP